MLDVFTPTLGTRYVTGYPPPPGRLASFGATTVTWLKSDAWRLRLLLTKKLLNERRLYPTSSDVRGRISCWIDTPNCQSYGRTPRPLSTAGLTWVSAFGFAKFPKSAAMHSPFGFGLSRLQSGTWLPL